MGEQELTYPAIIYLQPDVAELFNFASWKLTQNESLLVNPIPTSVYNWIKPGNLALLAKIKAKMHPLMLKRYNVFFTNVLNTVHANPVI